MPKTTHGDTGSIEYRTWTRMKGRCYNKNGTAYRFYGGRGISVCDRWRDSFEAFLEDMGRRPPTEMGRYSLDRIDNEGNYDPGNCRWADRKTQDNNRSDTVYLTLNGVTRPMMEWVKITGHPRKRIRGRLGMGWSDHDALTRGLLQP